MSVVAQSALSTIVSGSIYALLGIGLVILWGVCNIFSFAHGAVYMLGAYLTFVSLVQFNVPYLLAILISLLLVFSLGYLVSTVMKPIRFRKASENLNSMFTFGLGLTIANLILFFLGPWYRQLPYLLPNIFVFDGVTLLGQKLLIILVPIVSFVLLHFFFSRTRRGLEINAVAQNYEMVQLIGGNPERIYALAMGLGFAFAGIAGILMGSIQFLSPSMGDDPFLKSFIVAALGGVGSFKRPIIAAYLCASIETLVTVFIGFYWSLPILLLLLIVYGQIKGFFGGRS